MEKFFKHRIRKGGQNNETLEFFEGSFFEAQCRTFELAFQRKCRLYLWSFSELLAKWVKMGEYRPDYTATEIIGKDWRGDILGERKKFTFDPNRQWEKIYEN